MFEDNYYEPLAEIYFTLNDPQKIDDTYCLYSRVFVNGASEIHKEIQVDLEGEEEEAVPKTEQSVESSVQCNSFTESQPLQTPKKNLDEIVSCYCSASHYSTDEHDSLRDSVLHHSDSGADVSESSRDLDWERYWALNGEQLIWESWISKYGSYIDPHYNSSVSNKPAEGEDTSFCIQSENNPCQNRIISFVGLLDNVTSSDSISIQVLDSQRDLEKNIKLEDSDNPKILVEIVKNEPEDLSCRRLSDLSETAKSVSEKSEDSLNLDESDKLRLSVFSRCSGTSAPLSAATDSMTNVTRMTLSSSDSSYGIDDSAKSSSILTSSDSANSVDQQWQFLWAEHFNEQYNFHYTIFNERHKKKDREEIINKSDLTVDNSKISLDNKHCDRLHQESIDEVGSIDTQDSISEGDIKPASATFSNKSNLGKNKSNKSTQRQRILSVGYLLQQLNSMSVDSSGKIDENLSSPFERPSTMENNSVISNKQHESDSEINVKIIQVEDGTESDYKGHGYIAVKDSKIVPAERSSDKSLVSCDGVIDPDSDDAEATRHGVKRCHETEHCESSIEKIKSAYQLMGFMYDMEHSKKICKASVWYKKRFSQIRFQNRILRLQRPPPNKHIYFDDDDECNEDNTQIKMDLEGQTSAKDISLGICGDTTDESSSRKRDNILETNKIELEDFSEKDDSTDDEDIYFSAEEDYSQENEEKKEKILKLLPKRRKKRQSKKKSIYYPQEMLDNPKIKKFWRRRYSLFSKFDEGVKMDAESWYSVTPEKIAMNIAERCRCDLVVDAFCGAGGNTIQLAFTCERVIAIDIDPQKIELARHNAQVYGVEDRIEFIVGDYLQLASSLIADVVFLSPPWGGPSYSKHSVFPLSSLQPVSGHQLFSITSAITDNIAFYLPKNINTHELVECAGAGGSVEVVQNFLDRELIAVTAYFGELVNAAE